MTKLCSELDAIGGANRPKKIVARSVRLERAASATQPLGGVQAIKKPFAHPYTPHELVRLLAAQTAGSLPDEHNFGMPHLAD